MLYQLTGWDACMTWRLPDGTTLMQNFVIAEKDCTPTRIKHWKEYIKFVWGREGDVECCVEVRSTNMLDL